MSPRKGFTLVEMLVVIGILALLIAMLMPVLVGVRRDAERTKCASNLRQIGQAFNLYAIDNNGYWPMAMHQWSEPVVPMAREKRWNHFLSKYLHSTPLNEDGSDKLAEGVIKDTNSVLWGCPSWDRVAWATSTVFSFDSVQNNGYAMNNYTFAPVTTAMTGAYSNWVVRTLPWSAGSVSANGWYYKASQWRQPSDRALVCDSVNTVCAVVATWPWWLPTTAPMPQVPNALQFTPDFNRHSKKRRGNTATASTINMLFCDGHVSLVSAREAFRAHRFK